MLSRFKNHEEIGTYARNLIYMKTRSGSGKESIPEGIDKAYYYVANYFY